MNISKSGKHLGRIGSVIAVLTLAGCGDNETSAVTDRLPEPKPAEAQPPPRYEAAEPFTVIAQLEADAEHEDGSTASQRIELGELVAARDFEPPEGFQGLAAACEVDRQRDAFVPGKLAVTNRTKRFPIEVTSGIFVGIGDAAYREDRYPNLPVADIAQGFSAGPSCEVGLSELPLTNVEGEAEFTIEAGGVGRQDFLLVIHDFYSPAVPSGRKDDLLDLRAGIYSPIPLATDWERTCVSASAPLDGETIRLDGGPITDRQFEASDLPAC